MSMNMGDNRIMFSTNEYNLDTVTIKDINNFTDTDILRYAWIPNPVLLDSIYKYFNLENSKRILDIGSGINYFKYATDAIDVGVNSNNNIKLHKLDLDTDHFPFNNSTFDFNYCRHTLEDLQNPQNAFNEIIRTSRVGFIETPSPIVECMNNVDMVLNYDGNLLNYKGYIHHRYIIWSNKNNNTLYFLPKYPILEHINFKFDNYKYLLNNYPVYWNNYYTWDYENKPNIVIYKNGVNMDILKDYINLVYTAINDSIEYTNFFISKITNS